MNIKNFLYEDNKKISSGLVLTDDNYILGCKVGYGSRFDIPKGIIDKNETPLNACLRETKEETGLDINPVDLKSYGKFDYLKGKFAKDLYIFKLHTNNLPDIRKMKCNSFFTDRVTGNQKPEVIGYKYIPINEMNKYFTKSMTTVLQKVI